MAPLLSTYKQNYSYRWGKYVTMLNSCLDFIRCKNVFKYNCNAFRTVSHQTYLSQSPWSQIFCHCINQACFSSLFSTSNKQQCLKDTCTCNRKWTVTLCRYAINIVHNLNYSKNVQWCYWGSKHHTTTSILSPASHSYYYLSHGHNFYLSELRYLEKYIPSDE